MRHWKITLMRDGRSQRQWHLRGESVTVGALPTCQVRLPRPAPDVLAEVKGAQNAPQEFQWDDAVILIEDVTCTADSLLRQAKVRISAEPEREAWSSQNTPATLMAMALLIAAVVFSALFADFRPQALKNWQAAQSQMEDEKTAIQVPVQEAFEAPRSHATLPGAAKGHMPLALTITLGSDLTKLLRGDGTPAHSGNTGKSSPEHALPGIGIGLEFVSSAAPYTSPDASLYRSPDLAGLFQPG